jgi:hypothetical protein
MKYRKWGQKSTHILTSYKKIWWRNWHFFNQMLNVCEHISCLHVLYYFFHDSYILTVFMIFQIANSATRTLMLLYVLEIKEHCDEHHEKFNLYCKEHERPCCRICNLENHKDCKNVAIMEEIIKNVSVRRNVL